MDIGQQNVFKVELRTLDDYHRRLTHLLERMERLEASLKSLPLASRLCNMDAVQEKMLDDNAQENEQHKENIEDVQSEM